ncbi:helicase-related protein [Thaumasiovibrio sp. DFM-14]|uniref:helicase-related protein n=1 Tax=Thaumasiovibrio sp. DFM-14 TaxID=3384792 RepID=UPI00399FC039
MQLPIDILKDEFITTLSQHHVVVEAETGSGKSTRLPIWAQQAGRVLVVQPRRIACTSLAQYLAKQQSESVGESIGYAVKFEAHFSAHSRSVFVTPGVALRWYSENQLQDYDVVIIDEMHLRRWDTDLLLSLLKQHNQHRLVVTSATLNSQKFGDYINGQVLKAHGRCYDVDVTHFAHDIRTDPDSRQLDAKVKEAIASYMPQTKGDVLVFLPGRKEIQQCQSILSSINADVIPLHASVSDDERQKALAPPTDYRRIILATNVAETSLTIPGVTLIIDSGLERRTHQRNGRTVLSLHRISQASAEQRKGRAGRVSHGLCVRLYGASAPLEAVTPPDMQREELIEPMLAAAACGYRLADLPLLEPLPAKTSEQATERLQAMAAIDESGTITPHGEKLYPLPIDPLFAHLITAMPDKATQEAMVDLASALSVPQRLYTLPTDEENREVLDLWDPLHCDANCLIQAVRGNVSDQLTLSPDSIREARQNTHQIREALSLPHLDAASRLPREKWLNAIIAAAPELVFVRRQRRHDAMGNGDSEVTAARESRVRDQDIAFIVFDQFHLPGKGKKQTLNLATCCAPIPLRLLIDNDLGELTLTKSQVKEGEGEVVVEQQRLYAGRVIETISSAPDSNNVAEAALILIKKNQLLPELFNKIKYDILQWNLYQELADCSPHHAVSYTDPEQWLLTQLIALELDDIEDLAMFSADDFIFEGIPDWERADFDALYPRYLQLADLNLDVEYAGKGKRVTVVYHSGKRKTGPKRWELPNWKGWKIQYRKASRIIDIR